MNLVVDRPQTSLPAEHDSPLPVGANQFMSVEELEILAELNRANPEGAIEADLGRFPAFAGWPQWVSDWYWSPTEDVAAVSLSLVVGAVEREDVTLHDGEVDESAFPATTPCADCGTQRGQRRHSGSAHYLRFNGERLGFEGTLCRACYQRATEARKHARRKNADRDKPRPRPCHRKAAAQTVPTPPPAPPCSQCETTEGPIGKDGQHRRYRGYLWELPGVLCADCHRQVRRRFEPPPKAKHPAPPKVAVRPAPADQPIPAAPPCAGCGTTVGAMHSNGRHHARFSAEQYGVNGVICSACRDRARRHQRQVAQGREVRHWTETALVPGDNFSQGRDDDGLYVSPAEIAVAARMIQVEHEGDGVKPSEGLTDVEKQQLEWAAMAAAERQAVVASRRTRHRWTPEQAPGPWASLR